MKFFSGAVHRHLQLRLESEKSSPSAFHTAADTTYGLFGRMFSAIDGKVVEEITMVGSVHLGPVNTSNISLEWAVSAIPKATKRPILMFREQIFDHLFNRFQRTSPKC